MTISEHKAKLIAHKTQVILFNPTGDLQDSCYTLFQIPENRKNKLYDDFPIIESIKEVLINLPEEEELYLPRIEYPHAGKDWVFDFTFYKDPDDPQNIVWLIQDFTEQYRYLMKIQQERNEFSIKKEMIAIKHRALQLKKQIEILNETYRIRIAEQKQIRQNVQDILELLERRLDEINTPNGELNSHRDAARNHLQQIKETLYKAPAKVNASPDIHNSETFQLAEALWTLIKSLHHSLPEKKHPIQLKINADVPVKIKGKSLELCMILHNIIYCLFSQSNKDDIHITISLNEKQNIQKQLRFDVFSNALANNPIKKILNQFDTKTNMDNKIIEEKYHCLQTLNYLNEQEKIIFETGKASETITFYWGQSS